jgi:hypothetical protein
MKWAQTAGGPLLLANSQFLMCWQGIEADDYELACSIEGYSGKIESHGTEYIVLNDEPLQTTVLRIDGYVVFVRWRFAPNAEALLSAVHEFAFAETSPEEEVEFSPGGLHLSLFDAASKSPFSLLSIDVDSTILTFQTFVVSPSADVGAIVHRLVPHFKRQV